MNVVFFLNKLHPHVEPGAYEEWVRTTDYPTARSIPSIVEYRVARIDGLLDGTGPAPYDYVERVVTRDVEGYRRDLADPRLDAFKAAWASRVAESVAVHGTVID